MKSIMQEASSISKAIEHAWDRAGKPVEFTVKVLEIPERNLFGMITIKSAKVAIFFDEKKILAQQAIQMEKRRSSYKKESVPRPIKKQVSSGEAVAQRSRWKSEMVEFSIQWLREILHIMKLSNITFTTSTTMNGLTFHLQSSVTGSEYKDRLLFTSFSYLLLAALRQKFKQAFKNFKVILIIK